MDHLFGQGFCDGVIRGAESVTHLKETLRTLNILTVVNPMYLDLGGAR